MTIRARNLNILRQLQGAPLDHKIDFTIERLKRYYGGGNGSYISFSGGKDSMVLLDIVRRNKIGINPVFIDTGLEYPEVREIGYKYAFEVIKPKMTFKQVLDTYGYPVISKSQAMAIRKLTTQNLSEEYKNKLLHGDERGTAGKLSNKWHYLLEAPFKISEQCCDVMKKRPAHEFVKRILKENRVVLTAITAEMAEESMNRQNQYVKSGCFQNNQYPKFTPMGFWTEQDVLEYIYRYELPIASIYGDIKKDWMGKYYLTGVKRTGCIYCMLGVHLEPQPNRFQLMHDTHPKLYDYCINKLELGKIMDYIEVDYKPYGAVVEQNDGQLRIIA
ncbi:phosphoadenosine phosphosulfate reductase family protein [Tissierella carlieri]|uniref:Phosphoadenosine phosphosulfate reductase family protein n=1 Tax=Tissierella carlieri TaxID=689904 RepID=A0ABT1SET3_9FIRM|nr:phosphoadenosine phosphosulfate reductase family protein [Tissierella carlieri]MCQ4924995.1 phosphoadenosine phosphosulfate reductase family protein [Tissierella carlieri]